MKTACSTLAILVLLVSAGARAASPGDLTVSALWSAQTTPWSQTLQQNPGEINKLLQSAWTAQQGALCAEAFSELKAHLDGAGNGCILHTGPVPDTTSGCSFDPNPTFSVSTPSAGQVVGTVALHNSIITFGFSMQKGDGPCNIFQTAYGNPAFAVNFSGTATVKLGMDGKGKLKVSSAIGNLTNLNANGANSAGLLIWTLAEVAGKLGILPTIQSEIARLKGIINAHLDFTKQVASKLTTVNTKLAAALKLVPGSFTTQLVPDSAGVHLQLTYDKCLPGQTLGFFACDKTQVCLTQADWSKLKAAFTCRSPQVPSCKNVPAAAQRGPLPVDGWFGQGTYACGYAAGTGAGVGGGYSCTDPGTCGTNMHFDSITCRCAGGSLKRQAHPGLSPVGPR